MKGFIMPNVSPMAPVLLLNAMELECVAKSQGAMSANNVIANAIEHRMARKCFFVQLKVDFIVIILGMSTGNID
jgi:hypothetical protein